MRTGERQRPRRSRGERMWSGFFLLYVVADGGGSHAYRERAANGICMYTPKADRQ
jgi:hypothetical protein